MNQTNLGKFLLRLGVGGLMLLHGINKLDKGIGSIKDIVISNGLPEMLSYGVYLGEVVAPVLILIGLKVRTSSLFVFLTMVMAIVLAHPGDIFKLSIHGASAIETPLLFAMASLSLMCLGGGDTMSMDSFLSRKMKRLFSK